MIKNFQLLIHQVLDSVELNEKTFRDRGYRIMWDNWQQTGNERDKTRFE